MVLLELALPQRTTGKHVHKDVILVTNSHLGLWTAHVGLMDNTLHPLEFVLRLHLPLTPHALWQSQKQYPFTVMASALHLLMVDPVHVHHQLYLDKRAHKNVILGFRSVLDLWYEPAVQPEIILQ